MAGNTLATRTATAGGPAGPGDERPAAPGGVVTLLLALAAAFYVVTPVLQGAALPAVRSEFGLTAGDEATVKVVGTGAVLVTLFTAGRAGDRWGRRRLIVRALAVLAAGWTVLVVAQGAWSYLLGRSLVNVAVAAVFVTCLASVPALNAPGRMTRVMGGWLAVMSVTFFVTVNLVPPVPTMAGLRSAAAGFALAAVGLLLLARRRLPETAAPGNCGRLDGTFVACAVAAAVLASTGLLLAPVWGWGDPRTVLPLAAAAAGALLARRRIRAGGPGRQEHPAVLPGRVTAMALATGLAIGFVQASLGAAVPVLVAAAGATPGQGALVLSAFGAGGAAGCLLARHHRIAPLTGCALGLPLAGVGLALLHFLPGHAAGAVAAGAFAAALVGFGVMVAQVPQMAWFLAALPRPYLGTSAALHPASITVGLAAAQALPYTSVIGAGPVPAEAHELLWIAVAVVAAAALVAGRPAVALGVAAAAGAEYLLVRALTSEQHAERPATIAVALAVGALTGLLIWARRQQAERLARSQANATALQQAVLHPVPARLGDLRLAGLYEPATAGTGIGGDFFEAVHTPYGTRVLIGDVRGKGLEAVQTVTDLLGCFRSQAYETPDVGELVARLDRQMVRAAAARDDDELFATALVLQHPGGSGPAEVVNCGHLAPLAVGPAGIREPAVPALLPLGFATLGEGAPVPAPVDLVAGETLVLHTDGLSEARNASGEFYPLTERLAQAPATGPEDAVRFLEADVRDWTHHLADDIAVIALTRAG